MWRCQDYAEIFLCRRISPTRYASSLSYLPAISTISTAPCVVGSHDAVVVGSGPNGLAAAIVIAQAGKSVAVFEANESAGGVRSLGGESTLPGYVHDLCSSVYPSGRSARLFAALPLGEHGLEWIRTGAARPSSGRRHGNPVGTICRSHRECARRRWSRVSQNICAPDSAVERIGQDILGPPRWPRHPVNFARFGLQASATGATVCRAIFSRQPNPGALCRSGGSFDVAARELGIDRFRIGLNGDSSCAGLAACEWRSAKTDRCFDFLFAPLGGEVFLNQPVRRLKNLPPCRVTLCDVTPRQLLRIAGPGLSPVYRNRLKQYRYGMGAFKIDWALREPSAVDGAKNVSRAATVHLGGTLEEIAASERAAWRGYQARKPFVLLVQPSLFDSSRAPQGKHTLWAYCHVPEQLAPRCQ